MLVIESWVIDDGNTAPVPSGAVPETLRVRVGRGLLETCLGAAGSSEGYVLANGQHDEYPDQDTVAIDEAFRLVEPIVSKGSWPADARWVVDR